MRDRQTVSLSGSLTMQEVPTLWREHRDDFAAGRLPETLDLSGLERVDSSAIALLLEWQAAAGRSGQQIRFSEPPESMHVIARLTGVDELLGWTTDSDTNSEEKQTS